MDGSESREDLHRCRVWDLLFEFGALHVDELSSRVKLRKDRVLNLLNHCWFVPVKGGFAEIAKACGEGRRMRTNAA